MRSMLLPLFVAAHLSYTVFRCVTTYTSSPCISRSAIMAKIIPTLVKQGHRLSKTEVQRQVLEDLPLHAFAEAMASAGHRPLRASGIEILQINVGKRCNQTCQHCHVDAGPDRKEGMSCRVLEARFNFLARTDIPTLDI